MRSYSSWNNSGHWRLDEALWAHWGNDHEKCFEHLTRVCLDEVTEDYDNEQTEQAAH